MKLLYPALFHKEEGGFWVEFPDLEGCFSQGDTIAEIYHNAQESLGCYCECFLEDGMILPEPSDIFSLDVLEDCFTSLVEVSVSVIEGARG